MARVTLSARGQLVIPSSIRKKLNLKPGKKLEMHIEDYKIVAYPIPDDPIDACCGIIKLEKSALEIMKEIRSEEKTLEQKR